MTQKTGRDGHSLDQCLRKLAYSTWEAANAQAQSLNRRYPDSVPNRAYRCHFNESHFHVGRSSQLRYQADHAC